MSSTVMYVYLEAHYYSYWKCPLILEMLNKSHWWMRTSLMLMLILPRLITAVVGVWFNGKDYDETEEWLSLTFVC